ncbi:hypothetical protein HPB47_028173 [Ixodes persulcatus]|uniref:Uncharacterized protein n=1 Tax=Ixodes persulcatus TaxID=34615 RepID=A0AC60PTY8_IXOPE|nr:hypothetical protein HPB47_028173 [Ixodes persulcatus]
MGAQDSRDGEILDSDAAPDDGGEWYPARAPRKRRNKETSSQDSEKDAPRTESLTVIFVPTKEGDRISSLSSLKLTDGLDLLCPECIVQIRPNERLNLIAVDVRNGFTTRTLLKCTRLCGLPVKAYEGLAGPTVEGVIKNVDAALPEAKIAGRLQSDTEIARVRRFGSSESVWITFRGSKLPSHVLLGRVPHPVMEFHHRPIQCNRCGGFGHYAVTCRRSVACSRCGEKHPTIDEKTKQKCTSTTIKCVNCGEQHEATSPKCQKWKNERDILHYSKVNSVDLRTARAAIQNPKSNPTQDGASTSCQRALERVTTKKHIVPEKISVPEAKEVVPASCASTSASASVTGTTYSMVAKGIQQSPRTLPKSIPQKQAVAPSNNPITEKMDCDTHQAHPPSQENICSLKPPTTNVTNPKPSSLPTPEVDWLSIIKTAAHMACSFLIPLQTPWACGLQWVIQFVIDQLDRYFTKQHPKVENLNYPLCSNGTYVALDLVFLAYARAAEYVGVTVRSRGELFSIISVYVPPNVCWDPEELREIEHSRPHVPQTAGGPEESPAASSQNERSRRLDEAQTT